jgi:hypothetical protein
MTRLADRAHDLANEAPRSARGRTRVADAAGADMQVVVAGCHGRRSASASWRLALRPLICLGFS